MEYVLVCDWSSGCSRMSSS